MSGRRKRKNQYEFITRKFPKIMQRKLAMQFIIIVLAFACLLGRITYINADKGSQYTRIVLNQQSYSSTTLAYERGEILDANGTVLSSSERVYNVILDVKALCESSKEKNEVSENIEETAEILEEYFEIEAGAVQEAVANTPDSRYKILKKLVKYQSAQTYQTFIKENDVNKGLKAVWLEEDYKRNYPYSDMASSVLGFANTSNLGVVGLESQYSSVLNGTDGRKYGYYEDASLEYNIKEAQNGNAIVTSIDQTVQNIVEEEIDIFNETYTNSYVEGSSCKNLGVLVMNPNTAEVIASANYPNYDLNNPGDLSAYYTPQELAEMDDTETSEALNDLRANYTISDIYEPGSTVKPFTVAMALEMGLVDGTETYECTGSKVVNGVKVSCAHRVGHGVITLEEGLAQSCNVVMMDLVEKIEIEAFTEYQKFFGFGEKTGIDLPNEADGLLYDAEKMTPIDLATNSFGQNFNTTMIQVATGMCALINGGYYYQPHFVTQIKDSSGSVIKNIEPVLEKTIISEETSEILRGYLRTVVEEGTGKSAAVEGYDVGGKTGTAEKLPRKNGTYLVSFIGAVPINNPEVLIYVVIDEPNAKEQANSKFAQELASNILKQVLPYMGIEKNEVIIEDDVEVIDAQ